ncbi:response regulator [Thiomicrorhabdus arctica]|uniref:response regulator n=1 Tax=Thiomicrorhabdus arctica TaxID=131540 RepID=UPI0003767A25|nr:HD domain-containing phosphohydrolase [Thiomicrorhabdus arctica]
MNYENKILIVDDAPENIEYIELVLSEDGYCFSKANSGEQALELLEDQSFDLILLDLMMPGIDGFEVCRILKETPRIQDIPVVFLTARTDIDAITHGFGLGAVDYIIKPFNSAELLARVKTHIELHNTKKSLQFANEALHSKLELKERRLVSEIEEGQKEMILILTEWVARNSDETGNHIRRVGQYSRLLARYHPSLHLEDEEIIRHVAPMHDIGKVCVPVEILQKKGALTDEEFEIIKTHTTQAHNFFMTSNRRLMKAADVIASQHHEFWNGKGYPQGLVGEDIHIYARIVAVSDVFDALTHKREYKEAWPTKKALEYIEERSGTQFDPIVVALFLAHADEMIKICEDRLLKE